MSEIKVTAAALPAFGPNGIRDSIRNRYTHAAEKILRWSTSPSLAFRGGVGVEDDELLETGPDFGSGLYATEELARVPRAAVCASLGCGSPTADARLQDGQVVLDIGCGGGIDSILAASTVGPDGYVVGIDLSLAMISLADRNSRAAGLDNLSFAVGLTEDLPLREATVDVVISNAAVHLSLDKNKALAELYRVLRPQGRLHLIDIVADDGLTVADRGERVSSTNTTAGILSTTEYLRALEQRGFSEGAIYPRHEVADQVRAVLVTATRPAD